MTFRIADDSNHMHTMIKQSIFDMIVHNLESMMDLNKTMLEGLKMIVDSTLLAIHCGVFL